jgi:excisionase family DNA binding protein
MRPDGKSDRSGHNGELAEQIAVLRDAGVEVTPDYLLGRITVTEAAQFLGTTPGEIYNLTSRRQIPFSRLGKKGLRFCRLDPIQWQRERPRRPAR